MTNDRRTRRIPVMLTPEEVQRIDNYRWENRIGTRSETVRTLVRIGLDATADKEANQ